MLKELFILLVYFIFFLTLAFLTFVCKVFQWLLCVPLTAARGQILFFELNSNQTLHYIRQDTESRL